MPDADKPVARIALDTSGGPPYCEECDEDIEDVYLMEDGAFVCTECRTPVEAFSMVSDKITSVQPVKLKGAGHVCGDSCRRRGCKYDFPQEERNNPRYGHCALHKDEDECAADPSACRFGGCDGTSDDGTCKTEPTYFADTKSFFCKEHRKEFLEDYRWDDHRGGWVERR